MMEIVRPKLDSTKYSPDFREWVPDSLGCLLVELDHIISSCESPDPVSLFRGQSNHEWLLDSTFLRNCVRDIFHLSDYQRVNGSIRPTISFHRTIASLLLLKFGTVWRPSSEAFERERTHDIDPWYELLKNLQQYPEKDYFIRGTFLLDWSQSKDIALYFSTYEGKGENRVISQGHGALWIYDAVATGNIRQVRKLGEILQLMTGPEFLDASRNLPLIFHPPKQTLQRRAVNQAPIYVSQMDYRYDIADIWTAYENQNNKRVFLKLIIKEHIKEQVTSYLESKNISEEVVYPE